MSCRREWWVVPLSCVLWGALSACGSADNVSPEVIQLSIWPSAVQVGQASRVTVSTRDVDGDPQRYQWSASCPGTWAEASFASAVFTPTESSADDGSCDTCVLSVDVTDGRGGRTRSALDLCVKSTAGVSTAPRLVRASQSSYRVPENGSVSFEVSAMDPWGAPALRFEWTTHVGTLSPPSSSATTSQVFWNKPERFPSDARPRVEVRITNDMGLSRRVVFELNR